VFSSATFSYDREIKDIILYNASNSAETILTAVFQEHADFTKGMKTEDDLTLVIVKIL
jgi:serine phosphatase RsbU (regulator of sigma subunit)